MSARRHGHAPSDGQTCAVMIIIVITVTVIDMASARIRKALI